jgi:thiol-disulfide isomerase/thioredoxin
MSLGILALLTAGCDKPKKAGPAANEVAQAQAPPADKEGLGANFLDRDNAGKPAPSIAFKDPDGETVTLAEFKGKPLLLNLWATWCGPCIIEMPTLDRLAGREAGKIQVLALSQDLEGAATVDAFFKKHGLPNLSPYLDEQGEMGTALGVTTLPTTIYYDANGKELWRIVGEEDWASDKAAKLLREADASPPT